MFECKICPVFDKQGKFWFLVGSQCGKKKVSASFGLVFLQTLIREQMQATRRLAGFALRLNGAMGQKLGRTSSGVTPFSVARFATVAENTIHLQFVDAEGNRARLAGRVGQSLLEVAMQHQIDIVGPCNGGGSPVEVRRSDIWLETTFGEGANCYLCHVQIPTQFHHLLKEQMEDSRKGLEDTWEEEYNGTSRLACQITLTKAMDGMIVYVPDVPPTDVI